MSNRIFIDCYLEQNDFLSNRLFNRLPVSLKFLLSYLHLITPNSKSLHGIQVLIINFDA